jgi:hypothetical protein
VLLRYDRGTIFTARRWSYGPSIVLCALATLITERPFFAGGLAGMLGLVVATLIWQRVEARRGGSMQPAEGQTDAAGAGGPGVLGRS